MLKFREIALIALAVSAIWIVILVLQSDVTAYGEICEYTQTGQKECTTHHIILVVLWKIIKILNDAGVAVTALATIAIAGFTFTLKRSTDRLWNAGEGQLLLARDEFLSTHRPRLRVRSVSKVGGSPTNPITVKLTVVNAGDSTAQLIGSSVLIDFFSGWPPLDFEGESVATPRRFLPGASDTYLATSARKGLIIRSELNKRQELFVYGYFVYRDDLGTSRTTAFCRRWDAAGNRFCRIDDPDYEYED
jgi:hypothetical protein